MSARKATLMLAVLVCAIFGFKYLYKTLQKPEHKQLFGGSQLATRPAAIRVEQVATKTPLRLELHVPDAQAYDPMILWLEALCNDSIRELYRDYELYTRVISASGNKELYGNSRRLFIVCELPQGEQRVELKDLEQYGKYATSFNDYVLESLDEFLARDKAPAIRTAP